MVIGTDSHYLTPEEREYHKSYLNSKEGDREVDSFYKYTYLMDSNEVEHLLSFSFYACPGVFDYCQEHCFHYCFQANTA